jgi:drug/metabolite transporter (DMT)-like permease
MTLSVQIGLLLALATAFVSILGFLFKHRGAIAAPTVTLRAPVKSTVALFSNGWWTLGLVVATASWGFHVAALALAPITLVQSIIAGGLVLLTVVADRLFGFEVRRREWIGVALTAVGLAFLAATLGESAESAFSDYANGTLTAYVGAVAVLSIAVVAAAERSRWHVGVLLAAAAGLQWGASDVAIKALSDHLSADGALVLLHPLAAVIALLSLVGLVVSARSLQLGEAVPVIAATSAVASAAGDGGRLKRAERSSRPA